MEVVANNMVSETPVLEGAALEELKAFLELQKKMILEALDECFAARNAKWDALFARSGARTSGGSGVPDAAVAHEVTADLDLAAAATSITDAEPGDINTSALTRCSTEFPNDVNDVSMPAPARTVATEVLSDPDHVAAATSAIGIDPRAVSDEPDAAAAVSDHNSMASWHHVSATATVITKELIPDQDLAAAATSTIYVEPCVINIGTPSNCSTEFANLVIEAAATVPVRTVTAEVIPDPDHVTAVTSAICVVPSAVFDELDATAAMSGHNYDMATRHQVSATSTTIDKDLFLDTILAADASSAVGVEPSTIHIGMPITCSTKCRSVFIDITDAASAVYDTAEDVTLDLTTGCITIVVLFDGPDIVYSGLPAYWMDIPVMLETSSEVSVLNSWFSLDWVELQPWPPPSGLKFITDAPVLRPLPWPSFASGIPSIQIRYFCLARAQGCDLIAEPVHLKCGDTLAVGPALFLGLKPPWPPPARHNFGIMHVDLPMTSSSAQQLGVDARKEEKCSEDFLAMCCAEKMLDCGTNTRSSASCTDLLKAQKTSAIFARIILLMQQKCGGVCELAKWNLVVLEYYVAIAIGRVDCVYARNNINFSCDAKEIVDYHGDKLQFSVGPVQVSDSSSLELGFLMLSRLSTARECATLLKQPWPPPVVYVQARWGATWEKTQFLSLKMELQILLYYRIRWNNDLAELKSVLSISIWHYSVFTKIQKLELMSANASEAFLVHQTRFRQACSSICSFLRLTKKQISIFSLHTEEWLFGNRYNNMQKEIHLVSSRFMKNEHDPRGALRLLRTAAWGQAAFQGEGNVRYRWLEIWMGLGPKPGPLGSPAHGVQKAGCISP